MSSRHLTPNALQVALAGGAESLISVVWRCIRKDFVQFEDMVMEQACAALCNLTFENDANRCRVGEAGGCHALVELCRNVKSDRVLEQACGALANICKKNRTNRSAVGAVGGCEMLLNVLAGSPSEPTAVQVVRAIGNVAMRCPDNQLKLAAGDGLRQLLQLITTLSLRLASCTGHNSQEQQQAELHKQPPPSPGHLQCAPRFPGNSTPRSRGPAYHAESFVQLALSALAALTAHECCSRQMSSDPGATELLQRIATDATVPDTKAAANRVLSSISVHIEEEPPAKSEPLELPPAARGRQVEAQVGHQHSTGDVPKVALVEKAAESEDWDSSDYADEDGDENDIADHFSDTGSVASFYSRNSNFSHSRNFARSVVRESEEEGQEIDCGDYTGSYYSDRDSLVSASSRRSSGASFGGIVIEEDSDGEMDVELAAEQDLSGHEVVHKESESDKSESLVDQAMLRLPSDTSEDEPRVPTTSGVQALIDNCNLRLQISEPRREPSYSFDSAVTVETPGVESMFKVPCSPMSGEGFGLPPELLQALKYRHHPSEQEVDSRRERKQLQRTFDAWLDVAEALQRQRVALDERMKRFERFVCWYAFNGWRQALGIEDSDDDADEKNDRFNAHNIGMAGESPPCSPEAVTDKNPWPVQIVRSEDSIGTMGSVHPNRSICSEESFCTDARMAPTMPHIAAKEGIGSSVDMSATIASEASTRSFGSELSSASMWELQGPGSYSHGGLSVVSSSHFGHGCGGASSPPATGRSAEAALEETLDPKLQTLYLQF